MPHLGHRAPFLYESGLVTTTPVRTHLQLSRGTRAPGEVTRVPAPPPAGISTRPSPARRFTKALCPAESQTPDSRKVPGEKSKAEAKSASLGHPGGQRET